MIKAISNLKIRHKLQITGILYLLLSTIVVYFFISSNLLIKKSSRQQHDLNSLSVEIQHLEMTAKDYVYNAVPISELNQLFERLSTRIKATALAENFTGIQDLIASFSNLRSRNIAIENEITTLTESSLAASNDVIKKISDRLVGRNTRAGVSNMERAVIVGANTNTNANFRIRILFNKLKEDIGNKDSLVKFLDTLVANVTRDIELLKGTANEAAARQARETNLKVKALVLEFIDNINTLNALEEQIISNITAMDEAIGEMVIQSSLDLFSTIKGYFSTILAVILGAAIVGILVNFVTANTVTGSLKNLNLLFKDLADGEGDLTKRIIVKSKDETGDLAQWINLFIEKMQTLFKDVLNNADALNKASSELTAISEQMTEGVRSASERFERVTSAAGEMSANMSSVAAASEQASSNVSTVAGAAEEMAITVSEIARNTGQARSTTSNAVEKATEANTNISKLGEAALQISKVTEVITDISEQTNLLALNATIEAARAGDAGKGFAVVANEIKELARQTAQATQEIKIRVDDIQDSSTQTVGNIQVISKVISEVDAIVSTIATAVEEQAVSTQDIAGNVAQASQGIQEVNENVAHSSQFSDQIAQDVKDVNQTANSLSENSFQVDARAKALAQLAGNLNRTVGRFKL